jgi:hypothetical protein
LLHDVRNGMRPVQVALVQYVPEVVPGYPNRILPVDETLLDNGRMKRDNAFAGGGFSFSDLDAPKAVALLHVRALKADDLLSPASRKRQQPRHPALGRVCLVGGGV